MDDLERQNSTFSILHQTLCIISKPCGWIQNGATVWQCSIRVKISNFLSCVSGHLHYLPAAKLPSSNTCISSAAYVDDLMDALVQLCSIPRQDRVVPPPLLQPPPLCQEFEHPEKDEAVRARAHRFLVWTEHTSEVLNRTFFFDTISIILVVTVGFCWHQHSFLVIFMVTFYLLWKCEICSVATTLTWYIVTCSVGVIQVSA